MGPPKTDDGIDTDGDAHRLRVIIGTDVDAVDTDADQIPDDVEVAGFSSTAQVGLALGTPTRRNTRIGWPH